MVAPFVLEGAMNGPMFLAYVRQCAAERTIPRLLRRIGCAVRSFSPQECGNFFRHAGYLRT